MTRKLIGAPSFRALALPVLSIREECEALLYRQSFGEFIPAAWRHAAEPKVFLSNWHIDLLADHLMAVARREIEGPGPLVFTMPPRHMKSRAVNVFFPAWVWAQDPDPDHQGHGFNVRPGTLSGPGVKFAHLSYVQKLSNEQSDACRKLVSSDWYQARWGQQCQLDRDQIDLFSNRAGGERRAMSFSSLTGFGADIIVVDDAHDMKTVDSEVAREAVLRTWDEVLQTRLNDPKTGIFIVIMQRSHERDLIGHILAKEFNGMHVCLPAQHERNHPYVFLKAKPGWEVHRQTDSSYGTESGPKIGEPWYDFRQEGEPLWQNRFPKTVLEQQWVRVMTSHAVSGQLQQRPTAREGGLFKREWFASRVKFVNESMVQICRAWDLASTPEGTSSNGDYTVGVKMGLDPEFDGIYVMDVIRGRWSPGEIESKITTTARLDGEKCMIRLPQDPGGAGKFQARYLAGKLRGFTVTTEREEGSKPYRANPFAAQCENGNVVLVEGPWNQAFIDELCAFPNGAHDDQVDAAAAAFRALVRRPRAFAVAA
jgi:predicted phage terminase large subunit-like protein